MSYQRLFMLNRLSSKQCKTDLDKRVTPLCIWVALLISAPVYHDPKYHCDINNYDVIALLHHQLWRHAREVKCNCTYTMTYIMYMLIYKYKMLKVCVPVACLVAGVGTVLEQMLSKPEPISIYLLVTRIMNYNVLIRYFLTNFDNRYIEHGACI